MPSSPNMLDAVQIHTEEQSLIQVSRAAGEQQRKWVGSRTGTGRTPVLCPACCSTAPASCRAALVLSRLGARCPTGSLQEWHQELRCGL